MHESQLNYVHYGYALDSRAAMEHLPRKGTYSKRDLLGRLVFHNGDACDLTKLVQSYGAKYSKKIDMEHFHQDVSRSLEYRRFFTSLGCRGFSYRVEDEIALLEPLQKRITLRIALMPDELLFYPPRVKRYLRRVNSNHYFCEGYPSIAFALGLKMPDAWFVFVMQSDLALRSPSYIRDHFRGWRKILFANILRMASGNAEAVYLCQSEDVLRACHKSFPTPRTVPDSWSTIYDRTASHFGMRPVQLPKAVDIQLFQRQPRITAERFYALSIASAVNARIEIPPEKDPHERVESHGSLL